MLFGYENRSHLLGHSEKKCRLTGGIFAWESVFPIEKRIATPVCGLVRNDSVRLTERHYGIAVPFLKKLCKVCLTYTPCCAIL